MAKGIRLQYLEDHLQRSKFQPFSIRNLQSLTVPARVRTCAVHVHNEEAAAMEAPNAAWHKIRDDDFLTQGFGPNS